MTNFTDPSYSLFLLRLSAQHYLYEMNLHYLYEKQREIDLIELHHFSFLRGSLNKMSIL